MSKPHVLVTGATGSQGGHVARALLAAGHAVSALVRRPESDAAAALAREGATLVVGDLTDVPSLVAALEPVDAAYAVTTPFGDGVDAELAQGRAILAAAREASLGWLLLASVASAGRADVPHFTSKAAIEDELRATELAWTVVAPSYFYENVAGGARDGRLPVPLPGDVPLHQLALADLGAAVAAILARREEHLGARIELAGDAPTPREMAAALGAVHVETPLEEVEARSHDLAAMYRFLRDPGYGIDVAAVRERYPEVGWRSFADWAAARA
jgi:uncharacterized protein YbjT (DUF2867 family)